jgi:hypothetical protein
MSNVPYCLEVNGSSQYVKMGNVLNVSPGDTFSIVVWFKTTDSNGYLLSKMDDAPTGYGIFVGASGELRARLFSDATYQEEIRTDSVGWNDGTWHQVVWTYSPPVSGVGSKLWIDEVLQPSTVISSSLGSNPTTTTAEFNLGGRNNGSNLLSCRFTEVAFYADYEMSISDVSLLYNDGNLINLNALGSKKYLSAWWTTSDSSSILFPTVLDSSISSYHGTAVNMTTTDISSDTPGGVSTESLSFNAALTKYVGFGNVNAFQRTTACSFSFWVKTTSTTEGYIISKMTSGSLPSGYGILLRGSTYQIKVIWYYSGTNRIDLYGSTVVNDGAWHHVLVSYTGSSNASGFSMWVDGIVQTITVVGNNLTTNWSTSSNLNISGRSDGSVLFTGLIDEVSVYTAALTGTDAAALYNSGAPVDPRALVSAPTLVSYWKLGDPPLRLEDLAQYPNVSPTGGSGRGCNKLECSLNETDYGLPYASPTDLKMRAIGPGGIARFCMETNSSELIWHLGLISNLIFGQYDVWSVSAWFKSTSQYVCGAIIGRSNEMSGGQYGWFLGIRSSGVIKLNFRSGTSFYRRIETVSTWLDGNWHHVLAVKGGDSVSSMKIWVDGVQQSTTSTSSGTVMPSYNYSVVIGNGDQESNNYNYRGNLTEISVYNTSLVESDAIDLYNGGAPTDVTTLASASSLLNWWRLGNTNNFEDIPQGVLSSLLNRIDVDTPGGVAKKSIFFGKSQTLSVGNAFIFLRNEKFSISCWFKAPSYGVERTIIAKEDATRKGYVISLTTTGLIEWTLANTATVRATIRTTTSFDDNLWHHLVVTHGGVSLASSMKIYVDGSLQTVTTVLDALTADINDNASLYFGSTARSSLPLLGNLAEVSFYITELTAPEITEIYNGGVPADPETLTTSSDLLAYWSLGNKYYPGTLVNMKSDNYVLDYPTHSDLTTEGLWTTVPQYVIGAGDSISITHQRLILDWKNKLAANGWTVIGSSDGTIYEYEGTTSGGTYGGDSTGPFDVWETYTDVLWRDSGSGQGPSGWVVLQSPISSSGRFWLILWNYSTSNVKMQAIVGNSKPIFRTPGGQLCPFWTNDDKWYYSVFDENVYYPSGTSGCRNYLSVCNDGSFIFLRQTIASSTYWHAMTIFSVLSSDSVPDSFQKSVMYHYPWGTARNDVQYTKWRSYVPGGPRLIGCGVQIPHYNVSSSYRIISDIGLYDYFWNTVAHPVMIQPFISNVDFYGGMNTLIGPIRDVYLSVSTTPNTSMAPEKPPYAYICVEGKYWVPGSVEPVFA